MTGYSNNNVLLPFFLFFYLRRSETNTVVLSALDFGTLSDEFTVPEMVLHLLPQKSQSQSLTRGQGNMQFKQTHLTDCSIAAPVDDDDDENRTECDTTLKCL